MKFLCECGATVVDQTDYLSYKAYLFKDEDWDRVWTAAAEGLARLVTAARQGDVAAWAATHLPGLDVNDEQSDEDLVSQYLTPLWSRHMPRAYECTACGRLWIERQVGAPAEPLVGFRPESGRPELVLRSQFRSPGGERYDRV